MRLLAVVLAACFSLSYARAQTTTSGISQGQPPTQTLPTCSAAYVNGAWVYRSCAPGTGPTPVASATPTALTPTTIATTGTYQQAFPVGAATTAGGVMQAPSTNAAAVCLDISKTAAVGLTTPTGGQVCVQPGSSASFPATAGAGFIYGTKGDTVSGNAS